MSKLIGSTGAVASSARTLKKEFLERARSMDLKILVEEYVKARDTVEQAKTMVRLELESVQRDLEEYVLRRLLEKAHELPLYELLELAERAGVRRELLDKVPGDVITHNLNSLNLENLLVLFKEAWRFKEPIFEELIKRFKTLPCDDLNKYLSWVRASPYYTKEDASRLFKELITRIDCTEIMEPLFHEVLWVHRTHRDEDALEALRTITDKAIRDFDNLSCRKHLELLRALKKSSWHIVLFDLREKALGILRDYANEVLKRFSKCILEDALYDVSVLEGSLYTLADKRLYAEAVLDILTRDAYKVEPVVIAKVVDLVCKLGREYCCIVLEKLGLGVSELSKRALSEILRAGTGRFNCSSLIASFAHVLDTCKDLASPEITEAFRGLCRSIEEVWEVGVDCVQNPLSTIELAECVYALHVLSRDVLSRWCGRELEVPGVNLEKASEVIRRDLEKGVDPRSMRDAIRKLESVDDALSRDLMKLFDKHRRKLGITLKRSPW